MFAAILLSEVPFDFDTISSNPELALTALYIELASLGHDSEDSLFRAAWKIAFFCFRAESKVVGGEWHRRAILTNERCVFDLGILRV
jgi:hypothetical protein